MSERLRLLNEDQDFAEDELKMAATLFIPEPIQLKFSAGEISSADFLKVISWVAQKSFVSFRCCRQHD